MDISTERILYAKNPERENEEIIIVLLGSPSRRRLWKETETLIDKGFQIIEDKKNL
jgi:D-alanyl-D-alanine carboxypeptidase